MGVFYFEDKELPEYQNTDANKILKIDTDGIFLQWLEDTKELPVNVSFTTTAFNNGLTTSNGVNMMTLNQNGPANFNTFTPDFNQILTPTTNTTASFTSNLAFGLAVNPSNGTYVLATGFSVPKVLVSSNLTTWTNPSVQIGNYNTYQSVAFGNNVWAISSISAGQRTLYYTTDQTALTGWTQVSGSPGNWSTNRTINRMKFLNGQFVTLDAGSRYKVSTDCITWSEITINATSYSLQDIDYSPQLRRYVITTTSNGILYYSGSSLPTTGSNIFTFVSLTNGACNSVAWSPKLGMFVANAILVGNFFTSNDGINWATYVAPGTWAAARHMTWINDFGGFFIMMLQQANNNCVISRDGFNWTFIPLTNNAAGSAVVYNPTAKVFLFSNTNLAQFKDVNSLFSTFVDPDTVYNTFNSNTRFRDTIEYQPQVITPMPNNNQYMLNSFNRSTIEFDVTNEEAVIRIPGSSFNGKVGMKYRITKTTSTNFGLKIRVYENCTLRSPFANILNWNPNSPTDTYNLIPWGNFGSFDLTRIDDNTDGIWTGTWLVENLNVYRLNGGTSIKDLETTGEYRSQGDIVVNGNIKGLGAGSGTFSFADGTVPTVTSLNIDGDLNVLGTTTYNTASVITAGGFNLGGDQARITGVSDAGFSNIKIRMQNEDRVSFSLSETYIYNSLHLHQAPIQRYKIVDEETYTVSRLIEPVIILTRSTTSTTPARLVIPISSNVPSGLSFRVYIFNLPGRMINLQNNVEIKFNTYNALLFNTANDIKYFVGEQTYTFATTTVTYTVLDFYNLRNYATGQDKWLVTPVSKWVEPSPATTIWAGNN